MDELFWTNQDNSIISEEEIVARLRQYYLENVPDGYTQMQIQKMSAEEIWDMDYILNK